MLQVLCTDLLNFIGTSNESKSMTLDFTDAKSSERISQFLLKDTTFFNRTLGIVYVYYIMAILSLLVVPGKVENPNFEQTLPEYLPPLFFRDYFSGNIANSVFLENYLNFSKKGHFDLFSNEDSLKKDLNKVIFFS